MDCYLHTHTHTHKHTKAALLGSISHTILACVSHALLTVTVQNRELQSVLVLMAIIEQWEKKTYLVHVSISKGVQAHTISMH